MQTNFLFVALMKTSRSIPRNQKGVVFREQPDVQYIETSPRQPNSRPRRSRLKMEKQIFEKYDGGQVTETMLEEAAVLFSGNYGIWGEHAIGVRAGKLP
jgi:hypothetical protein